MSKIEAIIKKKGSLLPMLYEIQEQYGYLPESALKTISNKLNIPLSKIYGVVSFYFLFDVKKKGKYVIRICNSLTCHLHGSFHLLQFLKEHLGIHIGQTTKNNKFTLELTPCIGCCDNPPAMMINEKIYTNLTEEKVEDILKKLK